MNNDAFNEVLKMLDELSREEMAMLCRELKNAEAARQLETLRQSGQKLDGMQSAATTDDLT